MNLSPRMDARLQRFGEYQARGNYHEQLDPTWRYFPVYVEKMRRVDRFLETKRQCRILDAGCGEGVLVKKYRGLGYDIVGLDQDYEAPDDDVQRGSLLDMPMAENEFDLVLCLDVMEHIDVANQSRAISEIYRVLRPGGMLLATIPNLAHLASRLRFLVTGQLIRTSTIDHHPGDRPFAEWKGLLAERFEVEKTYGIFPTFPLLAVLTHFWPQRSLPLHRVYNRLLPINSLCFLNFFECRKVAALA